MCVVRFVFLNWIFAIVNIICNSRFEHVSVWSKKKMVRKIGNYTRNFFFFFEIMNNCISFDFVIHWIWINRFVWVGFFSIHLWEILIKLLSKFPCGPTQSNENMENRFLFQFIFKDSSEHFWMKKKNLTNVVYKTPSEDEECSWLSFLNELVMPLIQMCGKSKWIDQWSSSRLFK